jgi:hypothetical protein
MHAALPGEEDVGTAVHQMILDKDRMCFLLELAPISLVKSLSWTPGWRYLTGCSTNQRHNDTPGGVCFSWQGVDCRLKCVCSLAQTVPEALSEAQLAKTAAEEEARRLEVELE